MSLSGETLKKPALLAKQHFWSETQQLMKSFKSVPENVSSLFVSGQVQMSVAGRLMGEISVT